MSSIKIIGLGGGSLSMLPLGIYEEILQAEQLILRTSKHPVILELENKGVKYRSFDDIYESCSSFEEVYVQIVKNLIEMLEHHEVIHYAVPGHPLVAERTVQILLKEIENTKHHLEIVGGQSFIDPLLTALELDPVKGLVMLDATSLKTAELQPSLDTVIMQVYDQMVASEVKLTLMEVYPDDYQVQLCTAIGMEGAEKITKLPLYELDRLAELSNLTTLYVPATTEEQVINRQYYRSREIFRMLRGPNGCPWDKEQTHQSLKPYLLEEANEVLEAIDSGDEEHLAEELGDVLLQVFLHAQIAEDEGFFTMEDILACLNSKMVRRHPHVFGDRQVNNKEELTKLWQSIKEQEQKGKS